MNDKKDDKDKRSVFHVSISENEKKQVKKYAKADNTTISEFIRQAIFDKIGRIENPEIEKLNSKDDTLILKEISKLDKKFSGMEKILRERLSNGKVIKSTLEEIKSRVNHEKMEYEKQQIIEALKKHGSMRPKELNELTGIEVHAIYKIISDDISFKFDMTVGRIELNE
ncbi:hypothetical protein LCGC14_0666470 [marine sediment metagenome]|uniref:Uncharacterized protein n=1 Tax=marine sediment metagenome TaxID=412755 RepID=A0A0F9TDL9_9ZZZZ|nr:hypothetical protein [archaeon]